MPKRLGIFAVAIACCSMAFAGGPPTTEPTETASELGDLWRDRDAFYLRLDNHSAKDPGLAPAGTKEMRIKVEAMTRGRPWPGRWTVLELEVRPTVEQPFTLSFEGAAALTTTLPADKWTALRLPLVEKPADLILKPVGALKGKLEFRRVKLVDDRWVLFEGNWSVLREASLFKLAPTTGPALTFSSGPGGYTVFETGPLRALLTQGEKAGAVYASGRTSGDLPHAVEAKVHVTLSDDMGRLDRQSPGDADGDGYNERRGATILKVSAKRLAFLLSPPRGVPLVSHPALELWDLPPGRATVLWDGKLITTIDRLGTPEGPLLIEIPTDLQGPTRVEVSVDKQ